MITWVSLAFFFISSQDNIDLWQHSHMNFGFISLLSTYAKRTKFNVDKRKKIDTQHVGFDITPGTIYTPWIQITRISFYPNPDDGKCVQIWFLCWTRVPSDIFCTDRISRCANSFVGRSSWLSFRVYDEKKNIYYLYITNTLPCGRQEKPES